MPKRKTKYNSRFPPGRIKKIMQIDEEVGKVAAAVPVGISRAVELFIEDVITKSAQVTEAKGAKTISAVHMKQVISSLKHFDFLKDLVATVSESGGADEDDVTSGSVVESCASERKPEQAVDKSAKKGGRGRKKKLEKQGTDNSVVKEEEMKSDNVKPEAIGSSNLQLNLSNLSSSSDGANVKATDPVKQQYKYLPDDYRPAEPAAYPAGVLHPPYSYGAPPQASHAMTHSVYSPNGAGFSEMMSSGYSLSLGPRGPVEPAAFGNASTLAPGAVKPTSPLPMTAMGNNLSVTRASDLTFSTTTDSRSSLQAAPASMPINSSPAVLGLQAFNNNESNPALNLL